jgi:hypothetical protein
MGAKILKYPRLNLFALNLSKQKMYTMKRSIFHTMLSIMLTAFFAFNAVAQDDTYYVPSNETYTPPSNPPSSTFDDRRDGYSVPAEQFTTTDENGNTYITNNYYDNDDLDDWGYTSRMRRFYTPNFGVNYYSYWFTPSFYYGWNTWNTGIFIGFGNHWIDPFWGRGNRWGNVGFYDPWYDPFWSYNWGWNSCNYFNTWNNGWGGGFCSTPTIWGNHGWGWGGGGWCGTGGWGGGWNNGWGGGWNNGYWNGYNNGWNNGYWAGYNDGLWNSPYAYGGGWGNPYWKTTPPNNDNGGGKPNMGEAKPINATLGTNTWSPNTQVLDIPKEGITRPITEMSLEEKAKTPVANTKGQTNTPSTRTETEFTGRTNTQTPVAAPTTTPERWNGRNENANRWNGSNTTVNPAPSPSGGNNTFGRTNGNGNVQQNPSTTRPNVTVSPTPRNEQPRQFEPAQQPRQQVEPRQQTQPTPRQFEPQQQPRQQAQPTPRQFEPQQQPRQQAQPTPRQEQPRQIQPRQQVEPRQQAQPRQYQPSAPQPRQQQMQPRQYQPSAPQPRQQQMQPSQSRPQVSPSPRSGGQGLRRE